MSVPLGVTEIFGGLPFAVSFASAGTAAAVVAQRRRGALNAALHELRRPMQALALALPAEGAATPAVDSSLLLAIAAMERLDREINGGEGRKATEYVALRPLAEAAAARWGRAAESAGTRLRVDWRAGEVTVCGDGVRLAQALDNLIINGIEHGRGELSIRGERRGGCARVEVHDQGDTAAAGRRAASRGAAAIVRRNRRRGHGLRIVRRTAAEHGGRFLLEHSARGTEAVLELPLAARAEPSG